MPCAATPRGFTDTKIPWSDLIQNNPCGGKAVTSVAGVNVAAESLCEFHLDPQARGEGLRGPGREGAMNRPGDGSRLSAKERAVWIERVRATFAERRSRSEHFTSSEEKLDELEQEAHAGRSVKFDLRLLSRRETQMGGSCTRARPLGLRVLRDVANQAAEEVSRASRSARADASQTNRSRGLLGWGRHRPGGGMVSKDEQIHEDQEDQVEKELKDIDVPEQESADVAGGLRIKTIERDPSVAGQ